MISLYIPSSDRILEVRGKMTQLAFAQSLNIAKSKAIAVIDREMNLRYSVRGFDSDQAIAVPTPQQDSSYFR